MFKHIGETSHVFCLTVNIRIKQVFSCIDFGPEEDVKNQRQSLRFSPSPKRPDNLFDLILYIPSTIFQLCRGRIFLG